MHCQRLYFGWSYWWKLGKGNPERASNTCPPPPPPLSLPASCVLLIIPSMSVTIACTSAAFCFILSPWTGQEGLLVVCWLRARDLLSDMHLWDVCCVTATLHTHRGGEERQRDLPVQPALADENKLRMTPFARLSIIAAGLSQHSGFCATEADQLSAFALWCRV